MEVTMLITNLLNNHVLQIQDKKLGFDINRDGTIQDTEIITDANKNGNQDEEEVLSFIINNMHQYATELLGVLAFELWHERLAHQDSLAQDSPEKIALYTKYLHMLPIKAREIIISDYFQIKAQEQEYLTLANAPTTDDTSKGIAEYALIKQYGSLQKKYAHIDWSKSIFTMDSLYNNTTLPEIERLYKSIMPDAQTQIIGTPTNVLSQSKIPFISSAYESKHTDTTYIFVTQDKRIVLISSDKITLKQYITGVHYLGQLFIFNSAGDLQMFK